MARCPEACLWCRGFQSQVQVAPGSLIPLAFDQSRPPMPKQADIRSLCQAWPSCTAPAPAGPEEPSDLISCLNNCHTVWHVADLDVCVFVHVCVCECVRLRGVFSYSCLCNRGSDSGGDRWSIVGLEWNIFSAFHSLQWTDLGSAQEGAKTTVRNRARKSV